jgi:hypothetical protein
MTSRLVRRCVPSLLAACAASTALAQSDATRMPVEAAKPAEGPSVVLDVSSRLAFRADIKSSDADVLVSHTGAGVMISGMAAERLRLTFGVDGEYAYYDFDRGSSIMPAGSEPFDDLYSAGLTLAGTYMLDGPWSITAGGVVRYAAESGADFGDSIYGGGFLAVGYAFSERSFIGIGAGVQSRLEDDAAFFPYISVRHRFSDDLRFESRGLGAALIYTVSQQVEIGLKAAYESRQFRLNDDRPAFQDGVLVDKRVPVGLEVAWTPVPELSLIFEAGAVVWQEFEFRGSNGRKIDDFETEVAPFIGLRLEYRF